MAAKVQFHSLSLSDGRAVCLLAAFIRLEERLSSEAMRRKGAAMSVLAQAVASEVC